jgi:hypothetical protein
MGGIAAYFGGVRDEAADSGLVVDEQQLTQLRLLSLPGPSSTPRGQWPYNP